MDSTKKAKTNLEKFYIEKENKKPESLRQKQRWINKIKRINYTETNEEKKLYKKFCELAKADPDQKFKLKHLDDLGVNADLNIVYGKKGIGKTVQISKLIKKLTEEDPKAEVILMRNSVSEFQALKRTLDADYWPVYLKGSTNNPNIYHKEFLDENGNDRYVGFCVALNGRSLESAKGAEYPNVRLIIWDECTNTGSGEEYDNSNIERFVTFFDSIIRNKTNVKIYIFGNFHRNTDGTVSDVLLDLFHIPYGCKLKIIESKSANKEHTSKLLYINTGNLYSGIDANPKIGLFGNRLQEDLLSNEPQSQCHKVGSLSVFYNHTPKFGLLFHEGEKKYILLLSEAIQHEGNGIYKKRWMIHMEEWQTTQNKFEHILYTFDSNLHNENNEHNSRHIREEDFRELLHTLYEITLTVRLYYSGDKTRLLFGPLMYKWQQKYDLGATVIFKRNKRWKMEKN